jgi:hypothetical protein
MNEKKKPAGQVILEHDALHLALEDDIIEYRRKMEPAIIKGIWETVEKSKILPIYAGKDFYICLTTTTEAVLRQPKTVVWARRSCPTPVYKQSVWKYHNSTGNLEYLWTIPDALLYHHIIRNQDQYLRDKECYQLAQFVILMESGELLEWIKRENGEKIDAVIFTDNKENSCLTN